MARLDAGLMEVKGHRMGAEFRCVAGTRSPPREAGGRLIGHGVVVAYAGSQPWRQMTSHSGDATGLGRRGSSQSWDGTIRSITEPFLKYGLVACRLKPKVYRDPGTATGSWRLPTDCAKPLT